MIKPSVKPPCDIIPTASPTATLAKVAVGLSASYAARVSKVYAYTMASEALVIALVSGVPVLASLGVTLRRFVEGRRSASVRIRIEDASGRVIELDATRVKDAEQLIEQFLSRYPAEQSDAGLSEESAEISSVESTGTPSEESEEK